MVCKRSYPSPVVKLDKSAKMRNKPPPVVAFTIVGDVSDPTTLLCTILPFTAQQRHTDSEHNKPQSLMHPIIMM